MKRSSSAVTVTRAKLETLRERESPNRARTSNMADRIAYGRLAGVSRPPFPCSAFAQSSRHRGRTPRKIVRSAAAAVDTQRTPVRVNQLLIEKDQEQLVTTEQHISSSKDSLQNDMQSVDFGPTEFSQQSTPYDAEQDWHDRFGHYGR